MIEKLQVAKEGRRQVVKEELDYVRKEGRSEGGRDRKSERSSGGEMEENRC